MTADALAELKEAGDDRFGAALKAALWSDWSFKIQTRTRYTFLAMRHKAVQLNRSHNVRVLSFACQALLRVQQSPVSLRFGTATAQGVQW